MNLGFIGTGKIASSVIAGIYTSKISFKKILVSPRNKSIALKLKKKFTKIKIAKNNQEIINKCDWVFLSITPTVGQKIIKELKFKTNQIIISFISTISLAQLKKGPVPICPPNKKVRDFFNKIGTTVEIKDEKSSINFWSISGMMAPFYKLLSVMTDWLVKRGVKRNNAQKYITSLFLALSEDAIANSKKDLKYLVKESQTPNGLNEQGVKELTKAGFYKSLEKALNSIHRRLDK